MSIATASLIAAHSTGNTAPLSAAYAKYAQAYEKIQMTLTEAIDLSRDLAVLSLADANRPDLVVGMANGALLPATIVAGHLGVPCQIVYVRRASSRHKQRLLTVMARLGLPPSLLTLAPLMVLWRALQKQFSNLEHGAEAFAFDVRAKHVLVIDDAVHTGRSARFMQDQLRRHGAATVRIGVLCWYRGIGDSGGWRPDIHLHQKDQYYPWSSNSPYFAEFTSWLAENGLTFWT